MSDYSTKPGSESNTSAKKEKLNRNDVLSREGNVGGSRSLPLK
jgi:hypothetical protein